MILDLDALRVDSFWIEEPPPGAYPVWGPRPADAVLVRLGYNITAERCSRSASFTVAPLAGVAAPGGGAATAL